MPLEPSGSENKNLNIFCCAPMAWVNGNAPSGGPKPFLVGMQEDFLAKMNQRDLLAKKKSPFPIALSICQAHSRVRNHQQ